MSFVSRTIIWIELAAMIILMYRLVTSGRRNRGELIPGLTAHHKAAAKLLICYTIALVISIEALRWLNHIAHPHDRFFYVHLMLDIGFCVMLGLAYKPFNGRRSRFHWIFAYSTAAFFAGMCVTGFVLSFRF